ncbi:MAG TPA: ABC transporter permease [Candidatus Limnocylindrales bacterium]|jgi:ABC-2 type transport system permease protein
MSRPAPARRAVAALALQEVRLTARRGENVLVTLIIPVAVLLFFAGTALVPGLAGRPIDTILPGAIALAIIATGLVNLGIATAYERSYGVLKRLGGAPLPRWGLIAAKVTAVLALELVQVVLLVVVGSAVFVWAPGPGWSPLLLLGAITLGTVTFTGLGLLLAGTLRAEATLALANGLFLAFLMLGGIVLPVDQLPAFLQPVAAVLPATALADLLRIALGAPAAAATSADAPALILGAWAVAATGLATAKFRWD